MNFSLDRHAIRTAKRRNYVSTTQKKVDEKKNEIRMLKHVSNVRKYAPFRAAKLMHE